MKALRIHTAGDVASISYDEVPQPQPAAGEVLVKVYASGVSPKEVGWSTSTGQLHPLPTMLGYELSGVVTELGEGVQDLKVGDEVYGMPSFQAGGTQAEYVSVQAAELAYKPRSVSHIEASAVPLSGLTAWQALFDRATISANQTILIHGATGGVGIFAVQLAHWANATVVVTAAGHNQAFLTDLGADQVIDYNTARFEEVVQDVDVVLDLVGGDTLDRSWSVLKKGGILVSLGNADQAALEQAAEKWGVRATWFLVQPNREQLTRLAAVIDSGHLTPKIEAIFPLSEGELAYQTGLKGHNHGKLVLQVVE